MTIITFTFAATADDFVDVVATLERHGVPCQPRRGGYVLLSGEAVARVESSRLASVAMSDLFWDREGPSELLLFLHDQEDCCVAARVFAADRSRIAVTVNLANASPDEVKSAARAIERLLAGLPDARLKRPLPL